MQAVEELVAMDLVAVQQEQQTRLQETLDAARAGFLSLYALPAAMPVMAGPILGSFITYVRHAHTISHPASFVKYFGRIGNYLLTNSM
jgi:small neutral amino acid transporter SnatA (MarC family)